MVRTQHKLCVTAAFFLVTLGVTSLGVVLHSCKSSTSEDDLEVLQVGVQLGLHTETLFNKKRTRIIKSQEEAEFFIAVPSPYHLQI